MQRRIMQTDRQTQRENVGRGIGDLPVQESSLWQFMNNNVA